MIFMAVIRKSSRLLASTALVVSVAGTVGATAFAASLKSHASDGQASNAPTFGWDLGPTILTAGQVPAQCFYGPVYPFWPHGLLTDGLMPNRPVFRDRCRAW